jgi:hypothetical protein
MKASGTNPFLNTLISPYFLPLIFFISAVVWSLAISSELIPDFLEAESKIYLLNA